MTQDLNSLDKLESILVGIGQVVAEADYTSELAESMPRLAQQEDGMFASEIASNHRSWSPLKPSTIKHKGQDRELIDTGALRASLVSVRGPGNIAESAPRGLLFGTDIAYASLLQDGTSCMPARPPVGMSEETLDNLAAAIADVTVHKMKLPS